MDNGELAADTTSVKPEHRRFMIDKTIAQYHITEKIGEGGMGVVYKAHDTKLDRTVALKFLPEHLNASAEDKARFTQEARAASALNHPNVCTIHDIEEYDGQMFMVMEYVDGQTLREKMGSLSHKQAIEIGIQLADGLAAAHEKGITHRDIKPENIMVRKDGIALIMDFGLAKLRGNVSRLTKEGSTIGTAGYMSPEQVQGQDADHRSDIFSFGVVLYEMLTGQPPFKGIHETALAYEIVNVDAAPMAAVKTSIDPMLDAIILECLEKDPNERTQSVKQVSIDLKRFRRESSKAHVSRITAAKPVPGPAVAEPAQSSHEPGKKKLPLQWIITAALGLGFVAVTFLYLNRPKPEVQTIRSYLSAPEYTSLAQQSGGSSAGGHIAVSPDGGKIAYVATDTLGKSRLYIRPLNSLTALPIPGTEDAYYPFWSPNNDFIAFFAGGKLKKVDASGGPALTICDVRDARGGSWGKDDIIVFTPSPADPLYTVPAAGGAPVKLTSLDTVLHEVTHRFPWFLPDGKHFIYFARIGNGSENDAVSIGSVDGTPPKKLVNARSNAVFANGYIIFVRETALMAQQFDPDRLELAGNAVPIAEQVRFNQNWNRGSFAVSQNGILGYEGGSESAVNQLAILDRTGKNVGVMKGTQSVFEGSFSPDGSKIAFSSVDQQQRNEDIWVFDIARKISTRLTFDPATETDPIWSPDGKKIVFSSDRKGNAKLFVKSADGTGSDEQLFESKANMFSTSWSKDGKYIAYVDYSPKDTKRDLWIYPMEGDKKPFPFLATEFVDDEPRFSHDGKWIVYYSSESGQGEVYVRPFPGPGGKWQVSTAGDGGIRSYWRGDDKEIYYIAADGKMMAAQVNQSGGTFSVGAVTPLFDALSSGVVYILDVSPDGKRFLVVYNPLEKSSGRITLVTNWNAELAKK
jgi:eukaryotic-like serine/threonine-protein kinase